MKHQIFVNLPIRDMARTQAFWRALGYEFHPGFTDANGACLVLGEGTHAMLLVELFWMDPDAAPAQA